MAISLAKSVSISENPLNPAGFGEPPKTMRQQMYATSPKRMTEAADAPGLWEILL
eukprot:CAMPEP_0170343572 /NCGR_PEP_ID=MMETSP0116_2-20130129/72962_1 /TAXON_ID=400756 /ORGANISM="Durinskia baltica, Strain CSIRO CS-38" /LENGTH=54 /DNA_ID=CAMNT_0010597227 /DNA_START=1348 /DNA_END=1512 /DNA_ORIENTATION=+